ncbi:hypothetical protein [Kribbella sp. HUAS MG21]|jgi:hypothetical protein|uniref:Uncharacterized protein n=1 Tax=Kribbella sp. HUAS MG21 TaxID=3160966 RepID=A0AAU7THA9_9ACTN
MSDLGSEAEPEYEDQDSEPTMKAPDEGRPDGTIAPQRDDATASQERDLPDDDIGPPE